MSLKVVKFDTKMYLNFSNFRGRTSAGGGQALVQKRGQVSDGGGDCQNFRRMGGDPQSPQEKKTLLAPYLYTPKTTTNQQKNKTKQNKNIFRFQMATNILIPFRENGHMTKNLKEKKTKTKQKQKKNTFPKEFFSMKFGSK